MVLAACAPYRYWFSRLAVSWYEIISSNGAARGEMVFTSDSPV